MNKPLDEKALLAAIVSLQADAFVYSFPADKDLRDARKLSETAIQAYLEATQAGENEAVAFTDEFEMSADGSGLFALAGADRSWLQGTPIALYAAPPSLAAMQAENERLRKDRERALKKFERMVDIAEARLILLVQNNLPDVSLAGQEKQG